MNKYINEFFYNKQIGGYNSEILTKLIENIFFFVIFNIFIFFIQYNNNEIKQQSEEIKLCSRNHNIFNKYIYTYNEIALFNILLTPLLYKIIKSVSEALIKYFFNYDNILIIILQTILIIMYLVFYIVYPKFRIPKWPF